MLQKKCVYTSLSDAVIRGLPYNTYTMKSLLYNTYHHNESAIARAIRNHDWMKAKKLASQYLCSHFESKASEDLSRFNRSIGETLPPCKYPSPGQIYDQVMECIGSATDEDISRIGYNSQFAHKVCAAISRNRPWTIYFKSMIIFKVYKLWYESITMGHPSPPSVEVHCASKPDMPDHWEHYPTVSTPMAIREVPSYTLAYQENWGWYNAQDPSAIRVYYQSKAIAKRAFDNA